MPSITAVFPVCTHPMSASRDKPAEVIRATEQPGADRLRTVIEMTVCLVILVALFRTFLAGGYMIETGSMAPCLLGNHRQAVCPSCRYSFAVEDRDAGIKAICPNCGRTGVAIEKLSRNDGDQLLVHRGLFELRRPRRWEVVVFRNPNKPTQAYVKRMIALPGESVQIRDGDIYVGGEIQVKSYATQCGIRIPVYDHDFRPDGDDRQWQPRWMIDESENGWSETP
ncbi:MAG TPA: signal peptidase I, partial [Chloroflexota bacterium]|nr:signal peptidase I [Chloroflexota bacterium]